MSSSTLSRTDADYWRVRQDVSFAEILDTHLGFTPVPPAPPRVWTSPLLAFEPPPAPVRHTAQPRVEPALPLRLSSLERQTLHDAQTPDALRQAYRTLARRYHPDRHPGRSAAEHERLARIFAEATSLYQQLAARI
jgi:hypothetical protein